MNPASKIQNSPSRKSPTQSKIKHRPKANFPFRISHFAFRILPKLPATAAPPPIHHPKSNISRMPIFTFPISQSDPPIEILKSRHARG
jgi:hypothetical protein